MAKTLLLTGGSSGIGKACAIYFLARGWNVFFSYNKNLATAQEIAKQYDNAEYMQLDCSDSVAVKNFTSTCIKRFGALDAVIASAGVTSFNQIQDITDNELKNIFDVNFFGTFYLFREASKHFIKKKQGRLVAISSVYAHTGGSCETHYAASKAAINGFVTSLSQELVSSQITVNSISPGIVDTAMNNMHDKQELISYTPLSRLCEPYEIAATAFFLCSDNAGFITGQDIRQDGAVNF